MTCSRCAWHRALSAVRSFLMAGLLTPAALLLGYGAARALASACHELRTAIFAKVAQGTIRRVQGQVFQHLHAQDLGFHLQRQSGALGRVVDRGAKGINFTLSAFVFHVFPTALEVGMVAGILAWKCGPAFAALTGGTIAAYTAFTVATTQWRTKFRKQMNRADNEGSSRAMDSLLNYETVKYFGNFPILSSFTLIDSHLHGTLSFSIGRISA